MGRAQERSDSAARLQERAAQARKESRDVEETVARRNDDAVVDRLKSGWVRAARPRTGIEYCDHARPVYFNSAAEVDATPAAVRRQILVHNEMVARLCF